MARSPYKTEDTTGTCNLTSVQKSKHTNIINLKLFMRFLHSLFSAHFSNMTVTQDEYLAVNG